MNKQIDDKLYLRILQLGRENLTDGLKFNSLIQTLQNEGYTINNCTNLSIREWFYNSFFHEEAHCQNGNFNNVQELDNHKNCGFVLKADTCMKLLQYEESEKSNKQIEVLTSQTQIYQRQVDLLQSQLLLAQQSSNESKRESKSAKNYAIWALILTSLFGLPDIFEYYDNHFNSKTLASNNKQKESILQLSQLQETNLYLDSVNQVLLHQLQMDTLGNMYLKTMNESLKTLNKNLKRDKN